MTPRPPLSISVRWLWSRFPRVGELFQSIWPLQQLAWLQVSPFEKILDGDEVLLLPCRYFPYRTLPREPPAHSRQRHPRTTNLPLGITIVSKPGVSANWLTFSRSGIWSECSSCEQMGPKAHQQQNSRQLRTVQGHRGPRFLRTLVYTVDSHYMSGGSLQISAVSWFNLVPPLSGQKRLINQVWPCTRVK